MIVVLPYAGLPVSIIVGLEPRSCSILRISLYYFIRGPRSLGTYDKLVLSLICSKIYLVIGFILRGVVKFQDCHPVYEQVLALSRSLNDEEDDFDVFCALDPF